MGRDHFAGQMHQNPRARGAEVFNSKWFERFDLAQLSTEYLRSQRPLFISVGVDPNRSKNETSHWTGISAWAVDPDGVGWLIAGRRDKYAKTTERIRAIIEVCKDVQSLLGRLPHRVVWEGEAGQDQDEEFLYREFKRSGKKWQEIQIWFPKGIENPGTKPQKIESLQPDAEYGCLKLPYRGSLDYYCVFDDNMRDYAEQQLMAFKKYPDWEEGYDILDSDQLAFLEVPIPQWPGKNTSMPYPINDEWKEPEYNRSRRPDIRSSWYGG